mmetsp:Transcript_14685/g.24307  ORF Transcript_14685/g.24307 Transcript_14685/m.24307 type:complete len:398 (+) Transcript_14685:178-1371(+)
MGQCESIGESGAEYVHSDQSSIAWYTYYSCLYAAGVFALASVAVSFCLIYKHLSYYTSPMHQRYIVRILLMVPFYSVDSWLSFMFPRYSVYFDVVRDCYEAFVIYNFFLLLLNSIGGFQIAQKLLVGRQITLLFPFNCIHFTATGHGRFLLRCKNGTLQYVVIRPLMTFVAVFAHAANAYCPGDLHPTHVSLYTATVNFVSVTIAMYALITFYDNLSADLKPCKPLPKFLSIKFVIFFSFWQGVLIAILFKIGVIQVMAPFTEKNVAVGIQDTAICVEMIFAGIGHYYAFSPIEFYPTPQPWLDDDFSGGVRTPSSTIDTESAPLLSKVTRVLKVTDVLNDTYETFVASQRAPDLKELRHVASHKDSLRGSMSVQSQASSSYSSASSPPRIRTPNFT